MLLVLLAAAGCSRESSPTSKPSPAAAPHTSQSAATGPADAGGADISGADIGGAGAAVGVRIRFGLNDGKPTGWNGTVEVSPGRVVQIGGWRFGEGDAVDGLRGWRASTHTRALLGRGNNPDETAAAARHEPDAPQAMADNGVLVSLADVTDASRLRVKTAQGDFELALADLHYGQFVEQLGGAVEVERTASTQQLTRARTDEGFPATAVAADGTVYVAYVRFTHGDRSAYAPLEESRAQTAANRSLNSFRAWKQAPDDFSFLADPVGGDQLVLRVLRGGSWSEPIALTRGGGDIERCAVTVEPSGAAWVAWSENNAYPQKDSNFEVFARRYADGQLGEPVALSQQPGSDLSPALATSSNGAVWIAWQALREGAFRIVERHLTPAGASGTGAAGAGAAAGASAGDGGGDGRGGWSPERAVSTQSRDCWSPALAAARDGRIAAAWDTYEKGDYDVWLREFAADGAPQPPRPAADSADFEARPALTYDTAGALWIAYELGSPLWGKDYGASDTSGNPLYRSRQIGLIVLKDGQWMEPAASHVGAMPQVKARKRSFIYPVPAFAPQGDPSDAARHSRLRLDASLNTQPRIACDASGRIWLLCRSRENDFMLPMVGSLWLSWALCYDGRAWSGPVLIPDSDNLMDSAPAVAALPGGGLVLAQADDHRQDRVPDPEAYAREAGGAADPYDNDVFVSWLAEPAGAAAACELQAAQDPPAGRVQPSAATLAERGDVARCRDQSLVLGSRTLQLLRGEFHRHTEISADGGFDGSLEDLWRYALDVADMDWLGCGDHDNGMGREYTWWLSQKTTDAYRIAGRFEPPFTYERSVAYPSGHRNVLFAQRGVRTLPFLAQPATDAAGHAPDTQMLYRYLHHFGGLCASHTSANSGATNMGTDWRDNDPIVEPIVEIYQGDRDSYERPGAPRTPTADHPAGSFQSEGYVNAALLKGYRLAFECSSDHRSTHISYALVYAEDRTREGLLAALQERHVYGATDNIVAEFRCTADGRQYMLGDEFTSSAPPTFHLKLRGTAPFAKVTVVKDDVEIALPIEPKAEVELSWTDPSPTPGKTSYYYIRGEQADGELVWVSPMWVKFQPPDGK